MMGFVIVLERKKDTPETARIMAIRMPKKILRVLLISRLIFSLTFKVAAAIFPFVSYYYTGTLQLAVRGGDQATIGVHIVQWPAPTPPA
jgi:hypothetical protein